MCSWKKKEEYVKLKKSFNRKYHFLRNLWLNMYFFNFLKFHFGTFIKKQTHIYNCKMNRAKLKEKQTFLLNV